MPASREGFIVRVLRSGSEAPAGVGFVVDDQHIMTCAHVINTALGRDPRTQDKPASTVRVSIDFPILGEPGGAPIRRCRVEAWVPPPKAGVSGGDVAGLAIVGEGMPTGTGPARLAEKPSRRDPAAHVFGYPDDPNRQDHGAWAAIRLRGAVGGGLIQLDSGVESAIRAQPGYSGSPIVVEGDISDEVVAMLAIASQETGRDAYAITVALLADAWPDIVGPLTIPECPYRGLESFTADDSTAGIFVGREDEIGQLGEMVRKHSLVVVTGPSGVGKSSLVNAGLVRVMRDEGWITRVFQPRGMPFETLAETLFSIEQTDKTPTLDELAKWVDRLRGDGLASLGSRLSLVKKNPILLCIDQLEQILDPGICAPMASVEFLNLLLQVKSDSRLRVVCALRADFLSQLLQHPDAGAHLRGRLFTLSPMGPAQMEQVISEPAHVRGVRYESGLPPLIARDAGDGGGLPLLGFALTELWPRQYQHQITLAEYHGVGGVTGALRAYAERVYREVSERYAESQIRRVMLTLVRSRGGASQATRRVVPRQRLGRDWAVAEALVKRRLLVAGHDSALDEDSVQIAHEALIREWPRFAAWVDDDADFQHWLNALEERATDDDLLPETRLAEADRWITEREEDIPPEVVQLVERSKSEWHRRIAELDQAQRLARTGGWEENFATGLVRWTNSAFELFGLAPRPEGGISLADLHSYVLAADKPVVKRFRQRMLEQRDALSTTFRVVHPQDRSIRQIRIFAEPVTDAADTVVALRGAFQDISAQYHTQVALAATRDQLADAEQRLAAEHLLAVRLQWAIRPPVEASIEAAGMDVAVRYRPASERHLIGGDWYDTLLLPTNDVLMVVGDVAGNGVDTVTGMVAARNILRGLALNGTAPAELLGVLNRAMCHLSPRVTGTVVCGLYNPVSRVLRWTSAGHLPPVLVRGETAWELPRLGGIPLGMDPNAGYGESTQSLRASDTLLLFTDGLIERRGESMQDALKEFVATVAPQAWGITPGSQERTAAIQADRIIADAFSDTDDDACVVVIRIR